MGTQWTIPINDGSFGLPINLHSTLPYFMVSNNESYPSTLNLIIYGAPTINISFDINKEYIFLELEILSVIPYTDQLQYLQFASTIIHTSESYSFNPSRCPSTGPCRTPVNDFGYYSMRLSILTAGISGSITLTAL